MSAPIPVSDKRHPDNAANDRVLSLRQAASLQTITSGDRRAMRNLKLVGSTAHGALTTSLAAKRFDDQAPIPFDSRDKFG